MTRFISRVRSAVTGIVRPPSPSLLDAAFDGAHTDPAGSSADRAAAVKPDSPIDRLRSQRRDLAAALRADAGRPEQELATWPPATSKDACRAC